MAYLKPIKDRKGLKRWYSHIRSVKWAHEKYISLNTTSKTTARVRHAMIAKRKNTPDLLISSVGS